MFPKNLFWMGGVTSGFPSATGWIANQGYSNLLEALLSDNFYYAGHRWPDNVLLYLQENGHPKASKELVGEVDGYSIWKFHEK